MNTETIYTAKELLDLGYTQEQIDNAPMKNDWIIKPQEKFFAYYGDKVRIEYIIIENEIYIHNIFVNYKGYDFNVYINKNWKSQYMIYMEIDWHKYRDNMEYFKGNRPKGFTAKRFNEIMDFYVEQYEYSKEKTDRDINNLEKSIETLKNLGFTTNKTNAWIKTDLLSIDVIIYSNGNISIDRVRKNYTADETEPDFSVIEKLVKLK